jgi:prohibitin 2
MARDSSHAPAVRAPRLRTIALIALIALGMFAAWDSWYVVDAGQRVVTFNKVTGGMTTEDQGLHFKAPFVVSKDRYSVRGQLYTTTAGAASRDLQDVHVDVAVTYFPEYEHVQDLHREYGPNYADIVLAPAVQEVVKSVSARYNAEQLISDRVAVKHEIVEDLRERMGRVHVTLKEVDIRNFDFSDGFSEAVEAKVTQEQRALEERNRLEQVRYQALQKEASAAGEANATRIQAEGQAAALAAIRAELARDPLLLKYLELQKWNGQYPNVIGGANAGFSFLVNPTTTPTNTTTTQVGP